MRTRACPGHVDLADESDGQKYEITKTSLRKIPRGILVKAGKFRYSGAKGGV